MGSRSRKRKGEGAKEISQKEYRLADNVTLLQCHRQRAVVVHLSYSQTKLKLQEVLKHRPMKKETGEHSYLNKCPLI